MCIFYNLCKKDVRRSIHCSKKNSVSTSDHFRTYISCALQVNGDYLPNHVPAFSHFAFRLIFQVVKQAHRHGSLKYFRQCLNLNLAPDPPI